MENKSWKLPYAAFFIFIFAFFFLWFSRIHPLIPFDGDDWTYLSYTRLATPVWGAWNPSKVFPEIVYPFFSTIAAFALTPLIGDYISAQTLMHAVVISAAITGFLWCFARLERRLFSFSRMTASVLTVLFLAVHFLVFRTDEENNVHLLYCVSLNCYYNYLLPMLLSASLVMLLLTSDTIETFVKTGKPELKGLFFLVIYLAIFSNLPASGILAAYAGSRILLSLIRHRKHLKLKPLMEENAFFLGILALWLVSAVFELSGGRAGSAAMGGSILSQLRQTCFLLKNVVLGSNRLFLGFSVVVVAAALVCMLLDGGIRSLNGTLSSVLAVFLISAAAMTVYMIVLCAAVGPAKITGAEYLFAIYFHVFLLELLALGYLVERFPRLMLVLPLLSVVLVSNINTNGNTFREINTSGLPAERCGELGRYIIEQYQQADEAGQQEMVLRLPQFTSDPDNGDNWPYTLSLVHRISDTMYNHGLTSRLIDITPVIDSAVNDQMRIPLPTE